MILCYLHQDLSMMSNQSNDVDWSYYCRTLPQATVTEAVKWIKTTKGNTGSQGLTIQRSPIDISTLKREQKIA